MEEIGKISLIVALGIIFMMPLSASAADSDDKDYFEKGLYKSLNPRARRKNNAEAFIDRFAGYQKGMSKETREFIETIPADSMVSSEKHLKPKFSVSIKRGEFVSPFKTEEGDETPIGEKDVGLKISVKEQDFSLSEYLISANDALRAGQVESAAAYYRKVLTKDDNNRDAKFGLATTYHKSGRLEQARDMYIELISTDGNDMSALNNFLVLASQEAPDAALGQLKNLEKTNSNFAAIPAQIGLLYAKKGNLRDGARYLGKALSIEPENLTYQYQLAVLLEKLGHNQMAIKIYRQLLNAGAEGKALPQSSHVIMERAALLASK